jgi:hypothetical protein
MDFSIRQAAEKDYPGLNILFEEIDEHHGKALHSRIQKPGWASPDHDFVSLLACFSLEMLGNGRGQRMVSYALRCFLIDYAVRNEIGSMGQGRFPSGCHTLPSSVSFE